MKLRTSLMLCSSIALVVAASPTPAAGQLAHTVAPGESLWSIAAVNGLSVDELAAANGLPSDAVLITGATVLIPSPSGSGDCVWDCASTVHPHPTNETVAPEQVASIAAKYGMSPSLVQSIAWNESAFNNARVSSAGARGVMQIIPDTWNFIDEQLVDQPLDPTSAIDNVEAGVIYLHYLYHLKGGDGQDTVASYFQGPNRETLLPETEAYLREVRDDEQDFAGG